MITNIRRERPATFVRGLLYATALVTTLAIANSAVALTLVNRTESEQKVTIKEATQIKAIVLKPEEVKEGVCADGCVLALENGEELEVDGSEVIQIEAEGLKIAD